jgi:hypothetical protein
MMFCHDVIAERFEQSAHKLLPAPTEQNGNSRSKKQRSGHEFWAIFTAPRQCGVENPSYGNTHERRSHVWTIIGVLVQHPTLTGRSATSAYKSHWVNVEQKRSGATCC